MLQVEDDALRVRGLVAREPHVRRLPLSLIGSSILKTSIVNRRSFLGRTGALIALSLAGVPARAEDAARTLGRIWVSRPRWLGGLGLRALPAIPVDILGIVDSLPRLLSRLVQTVPAKLALTNEYTINGRTATALEWLYERRLGGGESESPAVRALRELGQQLAEDPTRLLGSDSSGVIPTAGAQTESASARPHVHLDDPRQFSMTWTNFDGLYQSVKPWEDFYAASLTSVEDANAQFWPTISGNTNSLNLLILRKVARFATGTLYVIDLDIFRTLQPHVIDGIDRFTPATKTWLWQDLETKALRPIRIRVSGYQGREQQTFTSTDPAWLYALQAAKTSIAVYGIWLGHVYSWHLVSGAMQATLKETLPVDHPLYLMLEPHSSYNIAFNNILFVLWLAIGPPTSLVGADEFFALCDEFAKTSAYFDNDPKTALRNLGLEQDDFTVHEAWDQFPAVRRYLDVWEATERYVGAVVDATYADDNDVIRDAALLSWIAAARSPESGNVRGLPRVRSRQTLKDVLTSLLYRITVHGVSHFNVTVHPALSFASNFPPCLHKRMIPPPDTALSTPDLLEPSSVDGHTRQVCQIFSATSSCTRCRTSGLFQTAASGPSCSSPEGRRIHETLR